MSKIGTKKHPVIARVQTPERAQEVFALCQAHGLQCIIGVEPGKPEDISDYERAASPAQPIRAVPKTGPNELCPCGSGKKFKKCCGVH